jgi:hypothetical protein
VVFPAQQLDITPYVTMSGSFSRVQQLISKEPNKETLGPFKASDANVRTIKTRAMIYFPFDLFEPL